MDISKTRIKVTLCSYFAFVPPNKEALNHNKELLNFWGGAAPMRAPTWRRWSRCSGWAAMPRAISMGRRPRSIRCEPSRTISWTRRAMSFTSETCKRPGAPGLTAGRRTSRGVAGDLCSAAADQHAAQNSITAQRRRSATTLLAKMPHSFATCARDLVAYASHRAATRFEPAL